MGLTVFLVLVIVLATIFISSFDKEEAVNNLRKHVESRGVIMNKQGIIVDVIRHLQKFEDQLNMTGETTDAVVEIDDYIDYLNDKYFAKK